MPEFTFTALNRTGQRSTGHLAAPSRAAALDAIGQRKLHPLSLSERSRRPRKPASGLASERRIPAASVDAFTRELANLLAGGVPLARSLQILKRQASQSVAAAAWGEIENDVTGGSPLADALAKRSRTFPPVYVAMVRAGETGGFLDIVLTQIAEFRARERDLLAKVKTALVYPCVLATLATGVLIFCLTYFIPKFSRLFEEFGAGLPALTRLVVGVSRSVPTYGLVAVAAAVLLVVAVRSALATAGGRRQLEQWLLAAPVLGRVLARFALVRFARILGTLLGAGVPLVAALRVAREAIGIQTLADAVHRTTEDVQRGTSMAGSLAGAPKLFPPAVVEVVAVAEESGRLGEELLRVASTYEGELDRELRMLVALAEPALLFVMAGLIGTIVVAMILPVFTLQDLIK